MSLRSYEIINNIPMFGWYILVKKRTLGGLIGYSSGRKSSSLKMPPVAQWISKSPPTQSTIHTFERRATRASNGDIKVAQVILVRHGRDARRGVSSQALGFLQKISKYQASTYSIYLDDSLQHSQ